MPCMTPPVCLQLELLEDSLGHAFYVGEGPLSVNNFNNCFNFFHCGVVHHGPSLDSGWLQGFDSRFSGGATKQYVLAGAFI